MSSHFLLPKRLVWRVYIKAPEIGKIALIIIANYFEALIDRLIDFADFPIAD